MLVSFRRKRKYSPEEIADIWFEKLPNAEAHSAGELKKWFLQWAKKHHVTVKDGKERWTDEEIRIYRKKEIECKICEKVKNKYKNSPKKPTDIEIAQYMNSEAYEIEVARKLEKHSEYQALLREDYAKTAEFMSYAGNYRSRRNREVVADIEAAVVRRLEERKVFEEYLEHIDIDELDWEAQVLKSAEEYLSHRQMEYIRRELARSQTEHKNWSGQRAYKQIGQLVRNHLTDQLPKYMNKEKHISAYFEKLLREKNEELDRYLRENPKQALVLRNVLKNKYNTRERLQAVVATLTNEQIVEWLLRNPFFSERMKWIWELQAEMSRIKQYVLKKIPDKYQDLYPGARLMQRHFVLHLGETNSGKTYEAMRAFRNAQTGVYLAPLRLLAYEAYETSNRLGCYCSMITGEEEIFVPFATHISSTIEMADMNTFYDVCVIDEAQMLANKQRGGAWTAAILGICAREIHICASEDAKNILIKLIELCGDTYSVRNHYRTVPLVCDGAEFHFDKNIEKHDALIVFSKRSVLQVAAELQRRGWKVSVIYGALPYEARQREVQRFTAGETDIVVATDAIGMGLNLPIKRIVFLETEKFDGIVTRPLNGRELKQIAGRAGRRGLYSVGYYTSEFYKEFVHKQVKSKLQPLEKVYLNFPETLLTVDGKLSVLLEQWIRIDTNDMFHKQNVRDEIKLARELEAEGLTEDKELLYAFVTLPFDSNKRLLREMWKELFYIEVSGEKPTSYFERFLHQSDLPTMSLEELEQEYKRCDLLYNYFRRFVPNGQKREIMYYKQKISESISDILAKQSLPIRKCPECGKELPWNYPYMICRECYTEK